MYLKVMLQLLKCIPDFTFPLKSFIHWATPLFHIPFTCDTHGKLKFMDFVFQILDAANSITKLICLEKIWQDLRMC